MKLKPILYFGIMLIAITASCVSAQKKLTVEHQNIIGCGLLSTSLNEPIPIFANPNDEIPFDIIRFSKVLFGTRKGTTEFQTFKLKEKLKPYTISDGRTDAENERFVNMGLNWRGPSLRFKVLEATDQYFKVLLNDTTHETGFIKKTDAIKVYGSEVDLYAASNLPKEEVYLTYERWENYLKRAEMVIVNKLNIYDAKKGTKIEKSEQMEGYFKVVEVDGNWAKIEFDENRVNNDSPITSGWIQWNDSKNILIQIILHTTE